MLILTRKPGESLYIGDNVKVTIVEIKGNQIRVGIDAPTDLRIYREEIYIQILEENRKAAESASVPESGLEGLSGAWMGRRRTEEEPPPQQGGAKEDRPVVRPLLSSMSTRTLKRGESPPRIEPLKKSEPQVIVKRRRAREADE